MRQVHKDILKSNRVHLVEDIDLTFALWDKLIQAKLVSKAAKEDIEVGPFSFKVYNLGLYYYDLQFQNEKISNIGVACVQDEVKRW